MTLDYGIAPPGYRLPDTTRLGPVRLQVADLGRSLDYYQRVLGLRLLDRGGNQALLGAEGEEDPLVVLHEHPGVRPVPRSGLLGLYHFAILLPDRQALGRFVAHLGTLGEHAGSADRSLRGSAASGVAAPRPSAVHDDRPPRHPQPARRGRGPCVDGHAVGHDDGPRSLARGRPRCRRTRGSPAPSPLSP